MALAVQIKGQQKLKKYTPCSDFSIFMNGFPRLVWELCSDLRTRSDERRMRAYGTSVVKLGNYILKDGHQPPRFILVAIYQTPEAVNISTFYQENDKVCQQLSSNRPMHLRLTNSCQIYQRVEKLDLTSRIGRFEFTRRLYKLVEMFKSDDEYAFSNHSFTKGLAAFIKTDNIDGTLYSRQSKKRKTDTRPSPDTSSSPGGGPSGSGFTVQGYELISDVIEDGKDLFEPFLEV
jgi:hypothetical protein